MSKTIPNCCAKLIYNHGGWFLLFPDPRTGEKHKPKIADEDEFYEEVFSRANHYLAKYPGVEWIIA